MDAPATITRRQALQRVAVLLGGTISAPTLAGVFAGDSTWWEDASESLSYTLDAPQRELIATIAEHIIPATDTPGARAAGVHQFVDRVLTDHYNASDRARFLAGLEGLDLRARSTHGQAFLACSPAQQVRLLGAVDLEAYPAKGLVAKQEKAQQPPPRDQIVGPGSGAAGALGEPAHAAVDGATKSVRGKTEADWFWRRMKELTLVGYYTSKVGATQELRVNPMGLWRGDIAYASIGRSWS
ncbi:MAG: lactose 3-dehydrogenase subunit gamma LacC [Gemmatimonadaceae bacterium]